ncbi:MAG: DUF296 domain-containing protein [Deltaproteobacteria bacterium]|nr:DUF296 domain-containing protein [Deltaproteobacteria bacterium]
MKWRLSGDLYWVVLEKGEDVGASLCAFFREANVESAAVVGIGALADTELGFLDVKSGQYLKTRFPDEMELVSFVGNVALVEGKPFLHAHAALSGPDLVVKGGHFFGGRVAVTMECQVLPGANGPIPRRFDQATGLKLIDLG